MDASTTISSTLLAVGGMQWLKQQSWFPLLAEGKVWLNRFVSLIVAGGISLGIHLTVKGSADAGWTGTYSIPGVWVLLTALFHWAAQFIYQETGHSILSGLQSLSSLAENLQSVIPPTGYTHPIPGEAAVNVVPVVK